MSEEEAKYYYTGLPSCPRLVARTCTTPWDCLAEPEELGPATSHAVRKGLGHRPARLEGRQADTVSTSLASTLKLSRAGRVGGSGNEGDVMNNKVMSGREGV
jgi:hypothetical protein